MYYILCSSITCIDNEVYGLGGQPSLMVIVKKK